MEDRQASFGRRLILIIVLALSCLMIPGAVSAQNRLHVEVGKSITLDDLHEVSNIFIADPTIADATVSNDHTVLVFGRAAGETTLITTALENGDETFYTVVVHHPISEIRRTLSRRFPQQAISVESSRGSVLLTGRVTDEQLRATVVETVESAFPAVKVIDRLSVAGSGTIRLQVRLLEINRTTAEAFGINIDATVAGSGWFLGTEDRGVLRFGYDEGQTSQLDATLDALVDNDIATVHQVTELSTVLGEPAEFSVGGQIPVPGYIPENAETSSGNFRLDYLFVGTKLTFTPTFVPGNKVQLIVDSTVSSRQGTTAQINGNRFPNLSSRSFRTSVEVVDRESFAIAGLTRNDSNMDARTPRRRGLARLWDKLFGADVTDRSTSEILVVVTPYLGPISAKADRLVSYGQVSNMDHILRDISVTGKKPGGRTPADFGGFKF